MTSPIDRTVSHSARIWNHWLGGTDNVEIDRRIGDQFAELFPDIVPVAKGSRAFLARAVTHLVTEAGVDQFLDIGTGLPSADNTHQIARRLAPGARVVYVDNDPLVLAHARSLLTGDGIRYLAGDLHRPAEILTAARETLDPARPVGLILMNILGHVADAARAKEIVAELMSALPPGSHLVVADGTNVIRGAEFEAAIAVWNASGSLPYHLRTPAEILDIVGDLDLLPPGLVSCPLWRPDTDDPAALREVDEFGLVARRRG